jgi:hypothetical protein
MDESADPDLDLLFLQARVTPDWTPARAERVWAAVMERLQGRRRPRRRLPSLLTVLRLNRAAR